MNKQDYIGKAVISASTKRRYVLTDLHAGYISVGSEKLNRYGTRSHYNYKVENDDPFTAGELYFEDTALNERFKREYRDYCRSEEGRAEAMTYWILTSG